MSRFRPFRSTKRMELSHFATPYPLEALRSVEAPIVKEKWLSKSMGTKPHGDNTYFSNRREIVLSSGWITVSFL